MTTPNPQLWSCHFISTQEAQQTVNTGSNVTPKTTVVYIWPQVTTTTLTSTEKPSDSNGFEWDPHRGEIPGSAYRSVRAEEALIKSLSIYNQVNSPSTRSLLEQYFYHLIFYYRIHNIFTTSTTTTDNIFYEYIDVINFIYFYFFWRNKYS